MNAFIFSRADELRLNCKDDRQDFVRVVLSRSDYTYALGAEQGAEQYPSVIFQNSFVTKFVVTHL